MTFFLFFSVPNYTKCHSKTEIPCRRTLFDERCAISNNLYFSRCGTRFIIYIPTIRKSYDSILKIRLDLDMNRKELNISDFSGQFENCKSTFTLLFKLSNLITSPLFQFQNSSTTISTRLFLLSSSSTDLEFFVKRNILQGWPRIPI